MSRDCNHKFIYKRKSDIWHRRGGEGNVTTEGEIGMRWFKPKECQLPQRLEEAKNRFSPRASRGSVVLPTPQFQASDTDFGLSGL